MELRITSCNNFINLSGELNSSSVKTFEAELAKAFTKFNALTINIDKLEKVDRHGVNALTNLYAKSIEDKKELSIVGLGCKELYDHFKSVNTAA